MAMCRDRRLFTQSPLLSLKGACEKEEKNRFSIFDVPAIHRDGYKYPAIPIHASQVEDKTPFQRNGKGHVS